MKGNQSSSSSSSSSPSRSTSRSSSRSSSNSEFSRKTSLSSSSRKTSQSTTASSVSRVKSTASTIKQTIKKDEHKNSSSDENQSRKFNFSPDPKVYREDETRESKAKSSRSSLGSGKIKDQLTQPSSIRVIPSNRDKIGAVEAVEMNQ